MKRIEDVIAGVMAGHDDEAPSAADLLGSLAQAAESRSARPGQPGQRRYLVPVAAAAAVAAVVIGIAWAGGLIGGHRPSVMAKRVQAVSPLPCPARYARAAPWVPARPSHVNGRARLVPLRMPSSAVLCAYGVGSHSSSALSGRRTLRHGLAELVGLLSWQPRQTPGQQIPCALFYGPQINYLIGLTYPGNGRLWVSASAPGDCVNTSNGEFVSFAIVGPIVSKAFASGRWPARPRPSCHGAYPDVGRLGQDTAMVPAGSTALIICARGGRTFTSGYQGLVSALNALPTFASTNQCSEVPGPHGLTELIFSYRQGPPVEVSVFRGCSPAINNMSLQATSARTILPVIHRLLGK